MGASGVQPGGAALPSLVRGECSTPAEHVAAASGVFPVSELLVAALSDVERAGLPRCVRAPLEVVASRASALDLFRSWADKLEGNRQEWADSMPAGSPARALHMSLIAFLARGINHDDTDLVKDLTRGMDITGEIPKTNVFRERTRVPTSSVEDWEARIPSTNARVIDQVMAKQGSEDSIACWNLSLAEAERGWLTKPVPVTPEVLNSLPLTPRFALPECHGQATQKKIRLIGDFKIFGVNGLLSSQDTCAPQGLDACLSAISFMKLIDPAVVLRAFTEDFAHAYKTVGIPVAQSKFATIALAPPTGPPHVATLRTQPFGSARAPANWGRVTKFIQHVLKKLFGVTVFVYVDDVFAVEPMITCGSAHEVFTAACELLGFELSTGKSQPPSAAIYLLGAELAFDTFEFTARLPTRRRDDLMNDIRKILAYDQLNPAQAAKLRGRLGFSQSLLFGKVGRALLQPLTNRQYSRAPGRSHPLSEDLAEALRWWLSALECAKPRTIPYKIVKPALVYTDACGAGHVSAIVLVDGVKHVSRTHLPTWFIRSGAGIFEFELAAVLLGVCLVAAVTGDRPALVCCDNMRWSPTRVRGG